MGDCNESYQFVVESNFEGYFRLPPNVSDGKGARDARDWLVTGSVDALVVLLIVLVQFATARQKRRQDRDRGEKRRKSGMALICIDSIITVQNPSYSSCTNFAVLAYLTKSAGTTMPISYKMLSFKDFLVLHFGYLSFATRLRRDRYGKFYTDSEHALRPGDL